MAHSKQDLIDSIKEMKDVYSDPDTPQSVKDSIKPSLEKAEKLLSELGATEKPKATEQVKKDKPTIKEIVKATHAGEKKVKKAKATKEKVHKAPVVKMTSSQKQTLQQIVASAKKYAAYAGKSEGDLKRDASRKAKKPGSRVSRTGHKYREYRANRSDVNTGAPHLAKGGEITYADGRPIRFSVYGSNGEYYIKDNDSDKTLPSSTVSYWTGSMNRFASKAKAREALITMLKKMHKEQPAYNPKIKYSAGGEFGNDTYTVTDEDGKTVITAGNEQDVLSYVNTVFEYERRDADDQEISDINTAIRELKKSGFKVQQGRFARGGAVSLSAKQIRDKILSFIKQFPDNPKDFSEATDELPDLHYSMAEIYGDEYRFDFEHQSSLSERNKRHKKGVMKLLKLMSESQLKDVWSRWRDTIESPEFDIDDETNLIQGIEDDINSGRKYNPSNQIEFGSYKTKNLTPEGKAAFEKAIAELEAEDHEGIFYKNARPAMKALVEAVDTVLAPIRSDAASEVVHNVLMTIGIMNYKSGLLLDTTWLSRELSERKLSAGGEIDSDEDEDFEEQQEDQRDEPLEDDCYISDGRRGGYDISAEGKHLGHYTEWGDAVSAINDWKKKHNYYPNTWYVGERGDHNLIDSNGNYFKKGGRIKSAINRDRKYKSDQPWEQSYHRKTKPSNPKYKLSRGGRPKSATNRDRKYKSNEPWEKSYKRKTAPKNPRYAKKARGGAVDRKIREAAVRKIARDVAKQKN